MEKATLAQGRKVIELLEGIPERQLQQLLESGILSDLLHSSNLPERFDFQRLCGLLEVFLVGTGGYPPLAEMIRSMGIRRVDSDIIEGNFPVTSWTTKRGEIVLFHAFYTPHKDGGDEIINRMAKVGCVPGDVRDMLALVKVGAKRLLGGLSVVALGYQWNGSVPVLYNIYGGSGFESTGDLGLRLEEVCDIPGFYGAVGRRKS